MVLLASAWLPILAPSARPHSTPVPPVHVLMKSSANRAWHWIKASSAFPVFQVSVSNYNYAFLDAVVVPLNFGPPKRVLHDVFLYIITFQLPLSDPFKCIAISYCLY